MGRSLTRPGSVPTRPRSTRPIPGYSVLMPAKSVYPRLEPLLPRVRKPIQYVGGELNSVVKDWDAADVRWALMYPDAYEVGLPNQGIQILYEVLNEQRRRARRAHLRVWPDLEALMREHGVPQFTVDAHRPVGAFDVLGVSFATELGYTNLLTALDLAGIPLLAADRADDAPARARRRPRRVQPRADRRLPGRGGARRRRAGRAGHHRPDPRTGSGRAARAAGTACCCGWPRRRRLRAPLLRRRLPAGRPDPAGRAEPPRRAAHGRQAHRDGPGRVAVPAQAASCRSPRPCTSGTAWRSSAAAPGAAGSARPG